MGTPLGVPSPGRRSRDHAVPRQPARFTAIADILFAIASGPVHAVWEEPDPPAEPDGIDLEHVLRETRRRLAVISLGGRPPLHADTLLTATAAGDTRLLSTRERIVLGLVGSGLIALRDIAFLVDRGALRGHSRRAAPRRDRAPRGRSPRGSRGTACRGTGAAASGACDGARRCAARAGGCSTGGPRPTPARPDRRGRRPRPVLPPQATAPRGRRDDGERRGAAAQPARAGQQRDGPARREPELVTWIRNGAAL